MANHPEPPTVSSTAREIFLRVLETDDLEGRDTLIDSACGDDDSVRSEVESLLRENEAIGDFLQGPAVVSQREPPKVSLPSREAEVKESRGDTIGPFKLLEPLGEGGCGMVYAAEQSTPVKRTVALKIIKLGMDTKSVIARFETERQALAMMDHPNIAKVFDAGATETGRPYFVMELVRGVPITTYCDREKLSTKQRLELFVQACNAIQHAHQKGIIHRDIKPSNILIGDHDGSPAPKVIDFGIAKATEQRLTEHTLDTAVEAFIGTPTYMSPEQAEVGGTDIDTRSDIYSLGILLYELLVGQPPFDAAGLQQLPIDEIRRTIRECEAERPSQKLGSLPESEIDRIAECRSCEPSKLAGKLRGDLDWIVIKCLEKDRSRRYATANALVYDIGRHLNSQPVLARPPSTLYRLKKLVRRHAAAITAGALLFATLVAGIAISWNHALRATRAERVAQEEKAKQGELAAQAVASAVAASLNEYVADINLAQLALSEGNFGRARQLLDKHLPISGEIDHRGFEWYYLSNLSRGDDHIALGDQRSSVQCLAYSPDGRTLAIGLRDEVRLWDVRAGRRITSLPGGATSLVFLPDGHTLASADRDTTWVVDTATWLEVIELRGHGAPIALSADGSQLATTSAGGIRVWDTTDWFELIHLREALPGPRAFSPDGKSLAARGSRGITLFSLATGRAALTLEDSAELLDARATGTLTFSADGSQIIAPRNTNSERGVFVMSTWDARTGRETGVLQNEFGHTANINQLGVHLGTNLLASASLDHSIGLWSLRDNALLTRLRGHRSEVWCVALSPDGSTVASGSKDGDLFLWPTSPQRPRDIIRDSLIPLAFSENGDRIATLDTNSKMTIFGLPSLIPLRSLSAAPLASTTPDLKVLAYADGGSVAIANTDTLELRTVTVSDRELNTLTLIPDGKSMLTGGRRQPLKWWDLERTAGPVKELAAQAASISADGAVFAAYGGGDRIEIWDVAARRRTRSLKVAQPYGFTASLSPDGKLLATTAGFSDSDNLVSVWDCDSGELLGTCAGHKQSVRSVAFTHDGRTMATASSDGSLKLWNVATRQELLSIRRLGSSLRHLKFSPDGQWLAGGSAPNTPDAELRLFHAPRG